MARGICIGLLNAILHGSNRNPSPAFGGAGKKETVKASLPKVVSRWKSVIVHQVKAEKRQGLLSDQEVKILEKIWTPGC